MVPRPRARVAGRARVHRAVVETYLFDTDTCHPATAKAVGGGSMGVPASGKGIMAHRESGDTVHTCQRVGSVPGSEENTEIRTSAVSSSDLPSSKVSTAAPWAATSALRCGRTWPA